MKKGILFRVVLGVVSVLVFILVFNSFFLVSSSRKTAAGKGAETYAASENYVSTVSAEAVLTDIIVISETPTPTPTRTPTPTPTRTPTPVPFQRFTGTDIDRMFEKYSREFSVDRNLLQKIAYCESGYNSGAANGIYGGMYQFTKDSWISTRARMNADTNPDLRFHAEESIKTAAFKLSIGGAGAWPNCSK